METRALAIAFFYASGTAVGGITGPFLFGKMIESGEESQVAIAFFLGAAVMAVGGIVELFFGVKAEQVALEDIAKPLTAEDAEGDGGRERDEAAAPTGAQRPGRDLAAEATERERRRRYRLGPGRTFWSPGMPVSAPTAEVEFEREVSAIEQALADRGPTERRELSRLVGARRWGPGRFSAALREAVESGRAPRLAQPLRPGRLVLLRRLRVGRGAMWWWAGSRRFIHRVTIPRRRHLSLRAKLSAAPRMTVGTTARATRPTVAPFEYRPARDGRGRSGEGHIRRYRDCKIANTPKATNPSAAAVSRNLPNGCARIVCNAPSNPCASCRSKVSVA
jgi:hypothetical protein